MSEPRNIIIIICCSELLAELYYQRHYSAHDSGDEEQAVLVSYSRGNQAKHKRLRVLIKREPEAIYRPGRQCHRDLTSGEQEVSSRCSNSHRLTPAHSTDRVNDQPLPLEVWGGLTRTLLYTSFPIHSLRGTAHELLHSFNTGSTLTGTAHYTRNLHRSPSTNQRMSE